MVLNVDEEAGMWITEKLRERHTWGLSRPDKYPQRMHQKLTKYSNALVQLAQC